MFCTGCGSPINSNEFYCHHCGKQLSAGGGGHPPYRQRTAPWVYATGFALLALMFYMTWAGAQYGDLETPAKEQLESIKEGNIPQAYYEFTSKQFQATTSLEQFRQFLKDHEIISKFDKFTFGEPIFDDKRGVLTGSLESETGEHVKIKYYLYRQDDEWKIDSFQIIDDTHPQKPTKTPKVESKEKEAMLLPIEAQLQDLKRGDVDDAYVDVSEDFKKVTTLPQFKDFIKQNKMFNQFHTFSIVEQLTQGDRAAVKLELTDDNEKIPVEYYLIKENDKWKIWSLQVLMPAENMPATSLMVEPVQEQLSALKNNEIDKAYNDFTSEDFKKITTIDTFKNFMIKFPLFTHYEVVDYKQPRVEESGGKLLVVLKGSNSQTATVEYTLGISDGKWKIWGLKLVDFDAQEVQAARKANTAESDQNTKILEALAKDQFLADEGQKTDSNSYYDNIFLGNEIDPKGNITDPKTTFNDPTKVIYANIFVNGIKGDILTITFRHNDTNSTIKPVSSSPFTKDGEFRTSFSFTPPPKGWPKGDYQLEITSSSGEHKTYPFHIE